MPFDLEFNIHVTVNSREEAIRLTDAVYSGYAAEIMRIGVLYGQIPIGGAVPGGSAPPNPNKQREAEIEVKRVESKQVSAVSEEKKEEPKPRPKGLTGRKRLGRS